MNWKFLVTAVLSVIVLAIFIGLGTWQLQRMNWKAGVIAEIEAKIAADPVDLPNAPSPEADKFLPVQFSGQINAPYIRVLASHRDFGAGYRIISPVTLTDGRRILLDRGFIRLRQALAHAPATSLSLTGNLHWPEDRNSYTPEDDLADNIWFARDVEKMAAHLGTDPVFVILRTQTDPALHPMPVTTDSIPNRHLEYVGTWFLLAITWSVMTGFALWRMKRRNA